MKSTRLVFISITNLLLFHTQLVLGSPDSTYFMVHEQTGLAECENNLDGGVEGHAYSEGRFGVRVPLASAGQYPSSATSEYQASPIQTPSIVEAFYSQNQQLLQSWKVGYDNSLFLRLDQPGFISPYFSLLRARNLIVP